MKVRKKFRGGVREATAIAMGRRAFCFDEDLPDHAPQAAELELIVCGTNREYGRAVWKAGGAAAVAHYRSELPGTRPGPFFIYDVPDGERPFFFQGRQVLRDRELMRYLTQPQWLHRRGLLSQSELVRLNPMVFDLGGSSLRAVPSIRPSLEDDHDK